MTPTTARVPTLQILRVIHLLVAALAAWEAIDVIGTPGVAAGVIVVAVVATVAVTIAPRHPRTATVLTAGVLVAGAFQPGYALGILPLLVTVVVALGTLPRRDALLCVVALAAAVLAGSVLTTAWDALVSLLFFAVCLLAGLMLRLARRNARRASAEMDALARRARAVQQAERSALADDLATILREDLADADERVRTAVHGAGDAEVAQTLAGVRQVADGALARLRGLVTTLRDTTDAAPVSIAGVLEGVEDVLVGYGFPVTLAVDQEVGDMSPGVGAALARTLREGAEALRSRGVPGGEILLECRREGGAVSVRLSQAGGEAWERSVPLGAAPASAVDPGRGHWLARVPLGPLRFGFSALALACLISVGVSAGGLLASGDAGWAAAALWAPLWLGLSVLPWAPRVATWLLAAGLVVLLLGARPDPSIQQPLLPAVIALTAVLAARSSRWLAPFAIAWTVAGVAAAWGRLEPEALGVLIFVPLTLGLIIGLGAGHLLRTRAAQLEDLDQLRTAAASARSTERRLLAGELHDVVAHQLTLIGLQVDAHTRRADSSAVRAVARRVSDILGSARADLEIIIAAGRRSGPQPAASATWLAPTVAVAAVTSALTDAGHAVASHVDPGADDCDPVTRRTASRILREATTNILRYGAPASPCRIDVRVSAATLSLTVTSRPAATPTPNPFSTGYGLLGLSERAALTGGEFSAGPVGSDWVVAAALPRWGGFEVPAAGRPEGEVPATVVPRREVPLPRLVVIAPPPR